MCQKDNYVAYFLFSIDTLESQLNEFDFIPRRLRGRFLSGPTSTGKYTKVYIERSTSEIIHDPQSRCVVGAQYSIVINLGHACESFCR
jgi:hypothetical protein